ncbi:putative transmembrane protein [Spiroplasma kunkelii CR2-3x]|uniref:Putative transmembrane protein n=1 Tax=Spiroplasma kunkelii CR2-3x TaxID=273035 RepID=A0A0K2JH49_SPIKU|nr:hypothetical protein [Spiroplasma kunkelii]ALA97571.1 putative transmembrane protein [Spiroplasma kunkelii CR2-3x]
MNYSIDYILFKDFCSKLFIRQWILENRYVSDGVFKFFLWMFIFAVFFLFTILSSWTFLHYKSKKNSASRSLLNCVSIIGGISTFFFSKLIWNLVLVPDYSIDPIYYRILLTGYSYVQLTITLAMIFNSRRLVSLLLYIVYASPFVIIGPVILNNFNDVNLRYDKELFIILTILVITIFIASLQLCGLLTRQDEKSNVIRFAVILILFNIINNYFKIINSKILEENIKLRQLFQQIYSITTLIVDLFALFILVLYLQQMLTRSRDEIHQIENLDLIKILTLQQLNPNLPLINFSKEEINPNHWTLKMLN